MGKAYTIVILDAGPEICTGSISSELAISWSTVVLHI